MLLTSQHWFRALAGSVRGRISEFRDVTINSPRARRQRVAAPPAIRRAIERDRARLPSPSGNLAKFVTLTGHSHDGPDRNLRPRGLAIPSRAQGGS